MSTTPLAEVSDADFVDQPDWSSSLYIYEDKTSWAKSLEKCYVKLPNAFKHYPFVLDPDTHDQMSIKTNAAENAINFIMDSYDKKFDDAENYEKYREMLHSRANKFFCCIRTYHPLTLHLKVKDFDKFFTKACFYSCPFGKGAKSWRVHHGIDFFGDDVTKVKCNCGKPFQISQLTYHLNSHSNSDTFLFHKAVMLYYQECYAKLPEMALKYAEMVGEYSADIFDNDKNKDGIYANTCEYDLHDSDYDDEEEVDIDPRIPVVPKKAVDRVDGLLHCKKHPTKM